LAPSSHVDCAPWHKGQAYCSRFALAERFRRTVDRPNPPRVCGPHYCLGRGAPAPDPAMPCALLQRNQNPSGAEQGCVALSRRSASWNHQITRNRRWTSSPIHPDLIFATHTYRLERRRNVCGLKKFHRGSAMIATPTGVNIAIRIAAVFIAAPPAPRSASRASARPPRRLRCALPGADRADANSITRWFTQTVHDLYRYLSKPLSVLTVLSPLRLSA